MTVKNKNAFFDHSALDKNPYIASTKYYLYLFMIISRDWSGQRQEAMKVGTCGTQLTVYTFILHVPKSSFPIPKPPL